jgi:hypothetical protein
MSQATKTTLIWEIPDKRYTPRYSGATGPNSARFATDSPSNSTYKLTCPPNFLKGATMPDVKERATLELVW